MRRNDFEYVIQNRSEKRREVVFESKSFPRPDQNVVGLLKKGKLLALRPRLPEEMRKSWRQLDFGGDHVLRFAETDSPCGPGLTSERGLFENEIKSELFDGDMVAVAEQTRLDRLPVNSGSVSAALVGQSKLISSSLDDGVSARDLLARQLDVISMTPAQTKAMTDAKPPAGK